MKKLNLSIGVALFVSLLGSGCYFHAKGSAETSASAKSSSTTSARSRQVSRTNRISKTRAPKERRVQAHASVHVTHMQTSTVKIGGTLRIYGDFSAVGNAAVHVYFPGVAKPVVAKTVNAKYIDCVAPSGSATGVIRIVISGHVVWTANITIKVGAPDKTIDPAPVVAQYNVSPTAVMPCEAVTVTGDFSNATAPSHARLKFNGTAFPTVSKKVTKSEAQFEVPKTANSGEIALRIRNRVVWKGELSVLGIQTRYRLTPTVGPVGTTAVLSGSFACDKRLDLKKKSLFKFRFTGVDAPVLAKTVTDKSISVVVPKGAVTGYVYLLFSGKEVWKGKFNVTDDDDGLLTPTGENGLVGNVWKIPADSKKLPDFSTLGEPLASIAVPKLDVAPRRFEQGFPGIDESKNLLEWFAIRFRGKIRVDKAGLVAFKFNSDDGAILYIDGKKVVDNDGVHAPKEQTGTAQLSAGLHDVVVEYFQGPRYQIALQLFWKPTANDGWSIVPSEKLFRP
ncbi:MAG: hypothetical protein IPJ88_06000 [Myxococcales bacterium]|nr:MAG: hypothetical protein IPJ88_06000 [Myxococcales bacterium]